MALDASPLGREQSVDEDDGLHGLAIASAALAVVITVATCLALPATALAALQYAGGGRVEPFLALFSWVTAVVAAGALLPAWIVTGLWLRAARRRIERRDQWHVGFGTTSGFLCWVVPVVNLYWPLPIVRELHHTAVDGARRVRVGLGLWWACWIGAFIAGRIEGRVFDDQGRGDPATATIVWGCIATALTVVACVQWVRVVRTTTESLR
ncbi:hypothetical protein GCM10023340_29290 [Nocardioides marinquilinus]|uniref:DUF4328 domain-containing protein n=1 Tax=Nocardioides marinquilinus TaxID=1210400 RepID=A0ABP9PRS4_9ACTN